MQSYKISLTAHRPLAPSEDAPCFYFSQPRAWQVSLARDVSRDEWAPRLEALELAKEQHQREYRAHGVKLDLKTFRYNIDGDHELGEGHQAARLHADALVESHRLHIDHDFDQALIMISGAKGLHLLDEDVPHDTQWPKLSKRGPCQGLEERRDLACLVTEADKLAVVEAYRTLRDQGLEGLTDKERESLEKPSPSEQP